jgi:malate dehydrogenase (oxaloacetate-decarboxylating)(NADP+)
MTPSSPVVTAAPPVTDTEVPHGIEVLHDPVFNKGTAFTQAERDALGIHGLLPPRVHTQAEQQIRVLENFRRKPNDLEKYLFLIELQDRNETLFYRTIIDHIETMMPIIYTPTVGEACRLYGHIFRRPRGLYVTAEDRGRVADVMRNWKREVSVIVVTDGERILGLGDLGAHGMGIPLVKLSLYTACAGVHPAHCLPIMLDVGTDNHDLMRDQLYIGCRHERLRGDAYDELLEEFISAVEEVFPNVLLQFEDFATRNALTLLDRYRDRLCCFNDDIQGTAAVVLAGLYSSGRITGHALSEQTILFLGAGSAATGIGRLIVSAMMREGLTEAQAMQRCWFIDSKGLIVSSRADLAPHKRPFAHDHAPAGDLLSAVESLTPTTLIGVSGKPQTFTEPALRAMARLNKRPIVFALSNPTSKSECTAEQAYRWTDGRAIFASGSPFDPVDHERQTFFPGQGNNAYIFPGLGLGVIACGARRVTDEMFHAAARSLADQLEETSLRAGSVYPPLRRIRDVSSSIAVEVARVAYDQGLATRPRPGDLKSMICEHMYRADYETYA